MEEEILAAILHLRGYRDRYFKTAKAVLGKAPGTLWKTDFYYFGVLNRSYCLLRGYCDLMDSENFLSAIPLVRLQLDCILRATAPGWVEDPSAFASAVLGGTQ